MTSANCSCETGTCTDCAEDMQTFIQRVRELHQPVHENAQGYDEHGNYTYINPGCSECGTFGEFTVPWPCPTIRLLDGEEVS